MDNKLLPQLKSYVQSRMQEFDQIDQERKSELDQAAEKIKSSGKSKIIVICTHNSRRSHFGQIWLTIGAYLKGIELDIYSGGTEATAFHPNAVAAAERSGLQILVEGENNPIYQLTYAEGIDPVECYSKTFGDDSNPQSDFVAILVCDSAAEACPFVPGASARIVLPYNDPKEFDGTDQEAEKYDQRCAEIARDMFYILSLLG